MNAYSSDLRERIAQAYDEGTDSQRALAARFRDGRTGTPEYKVTAVRVEKLSEG